MAKVSTLTIEAALNTYKGKSLNDLTKAAGEITKIEGDNSIMRRVQAICYSVGLACKSKGLDAKATETAVKGAFDTFRAGWYYKGAGGKREPLKATSVTAMTSALQNYGRAGLLPYNASSQVATIMHLEAMPLTQRGGKVGKLVDKHGDKAPSAKELQAIVKGSGKGRTPKRKASSIIVSMLDAIDAVADNSAVLAEGKANEATGINLRSIFAAAALIRKAMITSETPKDKAKVYKDSATTLTKAAGSLPKGRADA